MNEGSLHVYCHYDLQKKIGPGQEAVKRTTLEVSRSVAFLKKRTALVSTVISDKDANPPSLDRSTLKNQSVNIISETSASAAKSSRIHEPNPRCANPVAREMKSCGTIRHARFWYDTGISHQNDFVGVLKEVLF